MSVDATGVTVQVETYSADGVGLPLHTAFLLSADAARRLAADLTRAAAIAELEDSAFDSVLEAAPTLERRREEEAAQQ